MKDPKKMKDWNTAIYLGALGITATLIAAVIMSLFLLYLEKTRDPAKTAIAISHFCKQADDTKVPCTVDPD